MDDAGPSREICGGQLLHNARLGVVRNVIPYRRLGKRLIRVNKADVEEMIFGVKETKTDD